MKDFELRQILEKIGPQVSFRLNPSHTILGNHEYRLFDKVYDVGGLTVSVEFELGKKLFWESPDIDIDYVTPEQKERYEEKKQAMQRETGYASLAWPNYGLVSKEAPLVDNPGDEEFETATILNVIAQYPGIGEDKLDLSDLKSPDMKKFKDAIAKMYRVDISPKVDDKIRIVKTLGPGFRGSYPMFEPSIPLVYSKEIKRNFATGIMSVNQAGLTLENALDNMYKEHTRKHLSKK